MFWLIKKFGWLVALTGTLIGALFLPADFLDAKQALEAWQKVFTVGNREILLALICAACLVRLAYLDMRRAINDKDWPPVRFKLYGFLMILFRRSAREAKFKLFSDDQAITAYKKAALADRILESEVPDPIAQIAPPSPTPPAGDFTGDTFYDRLTNAEITISNRLTLL